MSHDDRHNKHPESGQRNAALDRMLAQELREESWPTPSAATKERARKAFVPARSARRGSIRLAILAAAAALALLLNWARQPDVYWSITAGTEIANITIGGTPLTIEDLSLVAEMIPHGGTIFVPEGSELELMLGDMLRIRLMGGTLVEIPRGPGRWLSRSRTLELQSGEAYGTSGPNALPFQLGLSTPEASAQLIGTTFAVFRTDEATCFCLYEGGLAVHPVGGDEFELEVEHRVYIYKDGRPVEVAPIDASERMKLDMIRQVGVDR